VTSVISGAEVGWLAEKIFQSFVTETTEEKIDAGIKVIQTQIAAFCGETSNKKYCQH
jgi:hypothetical protein